MLFKNSQSSMEGSLSRITIIYQVTGIQYFSISPESLETKTTSDNNLTRKHKFFLVTTITIVTSELCALIFILYSGSKQQLKKQHGNVVKGQIIRIAVCIAIILAIIVTILNSLCLRGKAKQIFKNFKNISKILSTVNQNVQYSSFENEMKIKFAKLCIGYIGSTITIFTLLYQLNQSNTFLFSMCAIYPYFFETILFSYWTLLICLIRENLRFVKECVSQLHENHKLFRINAEFVSSDLRMRRNHESYNFIAKLKRIYGILFDTTSLVNDLIRIPICLFLIFTIMVNISGGYTIFLCLKGDVKLDRIAVPTYTIVTSTILLCTLILSCSSTYDTLDEILSQIHKFEFNKFERENGIAAILLDFSLQIMQRPIEFKVGGFSCLTQPLLASIITGILTYILLLVQFYEPPTK